MRKIIVSMNSTFNDVVTGPADDKTNIGVWSLPGSRDDDLLEDYLKNFDTVDTIMLGRATYEFFATVWPFVKDWPGVKELELRLGEIINSLPKVIVASEHKVENPKWGDFKAPTQLTGGDMMGQIRRLKEQGGGDIMTIGSPTLVQSLTNADLVDEYRIQVYPAIVGDDGHGGYKRLFDDVDRKDLKLLSTRAYERGAMLVCYGVVKA